MWKFSGKKFHDVAKTLLERCKFNERPETMQWDDPLPSSFVFQFKQLFLSLFLSLSLFKSLSLLLFLFLFTRLTRSLHLTFPEKLQSTCIAVGITGITCSKLLHSPMRNDYAFNAVTQHDPSVDRSFEVS